MALEKTLYEVGPLALTDDGEQYGIIKVNSTVGFKLKQQVKLYSNAEQTADFEIKNVLDNKTLVIGPKSASLKDTSDLRRFKVSDDAKILALEQDRQAIPPDKYQRAVFEESPTVAYRTFNVDYLGNSYSDDNPFPTKLIGDSITVNAQLTALDNYPKPGDVHDSVRVGDGKYELAINPNGSINVVPQTIETAAIAKNIFNEIEEVASNAETLIVEYSAPLNAKTTLERVSVSGENLAKYLVKIAGNVIDVKRTYWTGGMNVDFEIKQTLNPGQKVQVYVIHESEPAQFSGRIQISET